MPVSSSDLNKIIPAHKKHLFTTREWGKFNAREVLDANPYLGALVAGPMGTLGLTVDFSGALAQTIATRDAIMAFKQYLVTDIFYNTFRSLVYKTPVHRGTARLNWKVGIGGKIAQYNTTSGGSKKYLRARDTELESPANKIGNLKHGGHGRKADSSQILRIKDEDGNYMPRGSEYEVYRKDGSVDVFQTTRAQSEFGKETAATERLIKNAVRLVDKEFGLQGRYSIPGYGKQFRGGKFTKLIIFNSAPYIRYLEGRNSPHGGTYKRSQGSKLYMDKYPSDDFVGPHDPTDNEFDQYQPGFIKNALEILRQGTVEWYVKEHGMEPKGYVPKGRKVGRSQYPYKASKKAWADYIKKWRRGGVTPNNPKGTGVWRVMTDSERDAWKKQRSVDFQKMWRDKALNDAGLLSWAQKNYEDVWLDIIADLVRERKVIDKSEEIAKKKAGLSDQLSQMLGKKAKKKRKIVQKASEIMQKRIKQDDYEKSLAGQIASGKARIRRKKKDK